MINELKNKYNIYKLVKNHFGLNDESLKIFKDYLFYNPRIPKEYSFLNEKNNYRKSFPLEKYLLNKDIEESKITEVIPTYNFFVENFYEFKSKFDINFENFQSNKFTLNKQTFKLIKYLFRFELNKILKKYNIKEVNDKSKLDIVMKPLLNNKEFEQELNILNSKLKYLIQNKSKSSNYNLVISKNFTDFFMCSTNQNFTSCLGLESEIADSFWRGLPGLITDPNRSIVYITKNDYIEEYYGITTHKFVSRAWLILSETGLHLSKLYPSDYYTKLMKIILKDVFKQNIVSDSTSSKYCIPLLRDINNDSLYLYQDTTDFKITENNKIKLSIGNKGGFKILDKNNNKTSNKVNSPTCLTDLIENNETVFSLKDEKCQNCGEFGAVYYEDIDQSLCENCFSDNYNYCSCCNSIINSDETYWNERGHPYCEDCYHERYIICSNCNDEQEKESAYFLDGEYYCKDCFFDIAFVCDCCGDSYRKEDLYEIDDRCYCEDCYNEKTFVCDKCGETEHSDCLHEVNNHSYCEDCYLKEREIQ